MDFKCVYFYHDTFAMMEFVSKHWKLVFNICYQREPDVGEIGGWCVRLLKPSEDSPQIKDILGR